MFILNLSVIMAQINFCKDISKCLLRTRILLVSIVLLNICIKYSNCQSVSQSVSQSVLQTVSQSVPQTVSTSSVTKPVKDQKDDKKAVDYKLREIGELLYTMKTKNPDTYRLLTSSTPTKHKTPTVVK